jgi:hypothetical protein
MGGMHNSHAKAVGHSAVNFVLANSNQVGPRANKLVNASINYYFSPGPSSPYTRQMLPHIMRFTKTYAPSHHAALQGSFIRKTPKILVRSVFRS